MKNSHRIFIYPMLCALVLAVSISLFALFPTSASETPPEVVSTGLHVLAEQNSMAMAGINGNGIRFDTKDFARALNLPLSCINERTITSVPPTTDGELLVGSTVIGDGQTLSASSIALLSYSPRSDIATSSFTFRLGDSPLDMTCKLYMLDKANAAPTLSVATSASLEVSTYCNTPLYGRLPFYDPEGDEVKVEIVSYPQSGLLYLNNPATGEYTYTPMENAKGKDSFTYVARDKYGNYSASATVSLSIVKSSVSVSYADLDNSPYANAAIYMTEKAIMSGTKIGDSTYFYPESAVSRAEFVVLAMNSFGITDTASADCAVFADGELIPEEMRGYIATAHSLGYINGTQKGESLCFEPDRPITKAEAAVILGNMLETSLPTLSYTPQFEDSEAIPAWATPSMYSLSHMGIINSKDGKLEPLSEITRGEAAQMLFQAVKAR